MKCPICKADLTPLDLVSRNEHVDLCIENGPSVVDYNESGNLVVKKNVPPGKQRKICPICDKTFQSIHLHFKKCALKFDVPPSLMLDHWDKINCDAKNPKKFPKDLLDNFVAKSIREGRVGDQVDFARALSLSMGEDASDTQVSSSTNSVIQQSSSIPPGTSVSSTSAPSSYNEPNPYLDQQPGPSTGGATVDASRILMQNAPLAPSGPSRSRQAAPKVKYPLELVDDETKLCHIELRVDRELAATRSRRYEEALRASRRIVSDDDDCILLDDGDEDLARQPVPATSQESPEFDIRQELELEKMFYKARLKACTGSESCELGECHEHELNLLIEGFEKYVGRSVNAPRPPDREKIHENNPSASNSLSCNDRHIDCATMSEITVSPVDCKDLGELHNIDEVSRPNNDDVYCVDDDDDNIGPSLASFSPSQESC